LGKVAEQPYPRRRAGPATLYKLLIFLEKIMVSYLSADHPAFFMLRQLEKEQNRAKEYEEMKTSRAAVARASHFAGVRQRARVVRRALQQPCD
jgi:hypothetical protein